MAIAAKLQTRSTFAVFALMVLMGFLMMGFISSISMSFLMESGSQMVNCPFAYGEQSMCPMTLADHFSAWHRFWLAVTPEQASAIVFMMLAVVAGSLVLAIHKRFSVGMRYWRYRWQCLFQPLLYLRQSYADGTIQPRLYA